MDGGDIRGAVHTNMRHDSAVKHVTGRAIYIDDMPVPQNCQETALVLSPYAYARIVSIDISQAVGMPGVSAVVSAKDIEGKNDIAPVFSDEPLLAEGTADYAGMPVAAVAADTYDQALAAARLIKVEYEELEPVLSIEEAWEKGQFTYTPPKIVFGDAEATIEKSPRTISGEVRCGGQDHFYLESHIALVVPGEDRDMTVYSSTQHPTEVQHGVSHVLGIAQNDVTVEVRRMGGGFGGKESQSTIVAGIAALLAAKCRKPVKLRLRRDDDMIATGKRHDFLFRYRIGFDETGRIDSAIIDMATRSGNVADLSAGVVARALCHGNNAYYIPNVIFRGWPCKTNTVSNTAFRGFGGPQGMLAIETA
ncbi:MAG: molybdopterin-dependent oxidoreductase, partial [Rhodospirillaceae bacterium]|nr:molybdopterin-dependent oxidoreductase [Rhodospirillaceae bacterium]